MVLLKKIDFQAEAIDSNNERNEQMEDFRDFDQTLLLLSINFEWKNDKTNIFIRKNIKFDKTQVKMLCQHPECCVDF